MVHISSLDHLVLTVSDFGRTIGFYQGVLGMTARNFTAADGSERFALYFGEQKINLHQQGQEFDPKAKAPTPGSADLCFLTDTPLPNWIAHFDAQKVEIEEGPVKRSGATGPITSLYLRDPDANLIEISTNDH